VVGMFIGTRMANRFDAPGLRLVVGVVLLLVAPAVLFGAFRNIN